MESIPVWLTKIRAQQAAHTRQKQVPSSDDATHTKEIQCIILEHPSVQIVKTLFTSQTGTPQTKQQAPITGLSHLFHIQDSKRLSAVADQPTRKLPQVFIKTKQNTKKAHVVENLQTLILPAITATLTQSHPQPSTTPTHHSLDTTVNEPQIKILETLKLPRACLPDSKLSPQKTLLLITFLCLLLFQSFQAGSQQLFGSHGWAYILGGPTLTNTNFLSTINPEQTNRQMTSEQYIKTIINHMSLDQKLGQMMQVQFIGTNYSLDLSTMISQYHVGSVLLLAGNHNILDKDQLLSLTKQIQQNSQLPMAISLDQEGGMVDRLAPLDGPRPSAANIGATREPTKATAAGVQDAQALSQYGINLQLAPVVDIGTPGSLEQQQERTFGLDPSTVTTMAGAYLRGLQQSRNVVGTLKHFPGLGSATVDPHRSLPVLYDSIDQLNQTTWAPYSELIKQGIVYAIMVTHEAVPAIDANIPASLSKKIVAGVLRDQMGFQGVIMTDSLTMEGINAYYSTRQAAVLAVEAGSDMIMGADSPVSVATILQGIRDAISTGEITTQRIDQSVSRILMMKYRMGLLTLHK